MISSNLETTHSEDQKLQISKSKSQTISNIKILMTKTNLSLEKKALPKKFIVQIHT